jgi:hypothetical protein
MPKINLLRLPDPAAQTSKFVNMMNATRQQEAAELQAKRAQQEMTLAAKQDAREEALQGPKLTKAQQDNAVQALEMFRNAVGDIAEGDVAAAEAVRADLVSRIPGYDKFIPPASQWTRDTIERLMMTSEKEIDKLYATPVASVAVNDRTGQTTSVTAGGLDPRAEVIGEVAPRATPTAPAPRTPMAPQTPTGPARTGKFGEALVVPEASVPLSPSQQDHIRQMQEGLGMSNTPASTNGGRMATPTAGRMSPDMVPAILDSAVQTGVMAQIDLDQMLALAPPPARQGIMDVIRKNNINLQADAPSLAASGMAQQQPMAPNPVQRPQAQFADMRGPAPQSQTAGLDGAPPMQNTMAQSQGRTPFIARREAPLPGSAQVPIERVRAEGAAGRASPAEIAANEEAKIGAQTRAKIAEENRLKTKGRKLFSEVLNDLRKDYGTLNKLNAIPSTKRGAFENIGDYIGASRVGRVAQSAVGAKASVPLNTISNSKLTLMNALKEATGLSATQLSSNIELMTFLDSLADPTQGYESAMETIRRLENLYGMPGGTPAAATTKRKTSTSTLSAATRAKYGL